MIHITSHAISRHMERCGSLTAAEADAALRSPAVQAAIRFGARCVRFGTGHRVVIVGNSVVTVKPKRTKRRKG